MFPAFTSRKGGGSKLNLKYDDEVIKVTVEINETEKRKIVEEINETKNLFLKGQ